MNIDSPLRELGPIDNSELSDAIMSLDESAWKENLTGKKSSKSTEQPSLL